MAFSSFFSRLFSTIFNRSRHSPDHFLLISLAGVSEALWMTPSIRAIKRQYPKSSIYVLTNKEGEPVFKTNPHPVEVFVLSKPVFFSLAFLYSRLRACKIAKAIFYDCKHPGIYFFCKILGIPDLIGPITQSFSDVFLSQKVEPKSCHEIQKRLEVTQMLGVQNMTPLMEIGVLDEDLLEVQKIFAKIPSYIPIIGIHPDGGSPFKRWPEDNFRQLAKQLYNHLGCIIVVITENRKSSLFKKIASDIPGAFEISGDIGGGRLHACLSYLRLFISHDTALVQAAYAAGVQTVSLYSPSDPKKTGPLSLSSALLIQKEKTCAPCLESKCREPFCMRQISVDEVFEGALRSFYS